MKTRKHFLILASLLLALLAHAACAQEEPAPAVPEPTARFEAPQEPTPPPAPVEEIEEEEAFAEPAEDVTGKRAGGDEGSMGDANGAVPSSDGQMVDKIDVKDLGINKSLGSNLQEQGPLNNVFGKSNGFDAKMGVAMSGEGNSLVIGKGVGGMGMRGTGGGGGGQGFGRIHGLGKVDTGGGRGVGAFAKPSNRPPAPAPNTEEYTDHGVNDFIDPRRDKLSTFSVDVDTGSYTIARRKIVEGSLPAKAAVRVEEFVNFFKYDYAQPDGQRPFEVDFEAAPSPFNAKRTILRVGVQGRTIKEEDRKPAHLVFLVDTSGSMHSPDKLPLVQRSLHMLVNHLKDGDTVALCTYAGGVSEVLKPMGMDKRALIHEAIEGLQTSGGTAMADGLETAYKMAYKHLKPGHVNRIIVLSDGDANIGQSSHKDILKRIGHYTLEGVTLSTVGFGMGNYKDTMMEQLANKGNGNYHYIDSFKEARRVFVEALGGTLEVIAKDVKIQVEFDPKTVESYRLIGYENRDIADKDFRNDAVDAGEIGAGHQVTALYELKMRAGAEGSPVQVRVRHKAPQGARASEASFDVGQEHMRGDFASASRSFRLAVATMAFAEKLRQSPHASGWSWAHVTKLAEAAIAHDANEKELLELMKKAAGRKAL